MLSQSNKSEDKSESISSQSNEKFPIETKAPRAILENADLVTARGNVVTKDGVVISTNDSDSNISVNVFADPEIKAFYVDVYEKSKYECRHVFDADLTWTEEEEKKLVRKLDWHGMFSL